MTNSSAIPTADALTLEEKAALTSGADFWTTKSIERVGVPSMMLTDGPHGLRKQSANADHLGLADSVPATCFPPAVGLGSSFDPELAERVGVALGIESALEDVAVILGPGINIKRSPLGGRNFEYVSEDPLVSGLIAAGLVRGIQSQGVGSSLKHFAANNQETDRMRVSSDIDARPLQEIYLRAFRTVVTEAQPWTIMCSYNRINGVYASEDPWLLSQVLRDEWGFEGIVVSDWGAVNNRVAGVSAGMDLEMPGSGGGTDAEIVAAVQDGSLDEAILDRTANRLLDLTRKASQRVRPEGVLDVDAHHALAREAAARSVVLLRNAGEVLPLTSGAGLAVVGAFAVAPRFQGSGSSLINPTRLDIPLDELRERAGADLPFAAGFTVDGSGDAEALRAEAVAVARDAETIVAFLGMPNAAESEGFDRTNLDLPAVQLDLLDALIATGKKIVVVLSNGGVVALPFRDRVAAIVEGWLLGQGGGHAIARVLFGDQNPSGRLTETIPLRLEDTAAFGNFPGEHGHVRYGEGLLVGYRWYDARQLGVAYPFGFGLSYTSFTYADAAAVVTDAGVTVSVTVTNTGTRDGREVVQVYGSVPGSLVQRAPRELVGFTSVEIPAGQSRRVEVVVRRDDLQHWDPRVERWIVEGGERRFEIGASSRDIAVEAAVTLAGDVVSVPLSRSSTLGELMAHPGARPVVAGLLASFMGGGAPADTESPEAEGDGGDMMVLMSSFPIGRLLAFPGIDVTGEQIDALIATANAPA